MNLLGCRLHCAFGVVQGVSQPLQTLLLLASKIPGPSKARQHLWIVCTVSRQGYLVLEVMSVKFMSKSCSTYTLNRSCVLLDFAKDVSEIHKHTRILNALLDF